MGSDDAYFKDMMASLGVTPMDKRRGAARRQRRELIQEPSQQAPPRTAEDVEAEERRLFLEAMRAMDQPKGKGRGPQSRHPSRGWSDETESQAEARPRIPGLRAFDHPDDPADKAMFLAAMADLDPSGKVEDEVVYSTETPSQKRGLARWFNLRKKARIDWEESLDLHGMNVEQALVETHRFVERCRKDGTKVAALITGKGKNSKTGEGVLGPAVESWIIAMGKKHIKRYAHAPRAQGGHGVVIIYFR